MWVDASNYTGPLSTGQLDDLEAAGVVGVIVQAITGNDGNSYTRQQLGALVSYGGFKLQGYVWCFPGATRASMQSRLRMFDGFPLEALWLDLEQAGLTQADVERDLPLCDAYMGRQTGIYSGYWFFKQQGWLNLTRWSDRPLWDSNFDGVAQVDANFSPYGGWTRPLIKQYQGTTSIGRVPNVDRDVV